MLHVRHGGQAVGELRAQGRALTFRYEASWLSRSHAFPLSPRLPLQEAEYLGDEVLSFFANLLPEGTVLDTLRKLQRLPKGNVYKLLEAFGRECAGAFELVVEPDTNAQDPSYEPYLVEQLRGDLVALRDNIPLLQRHGELRLSLAGAQNKIPVRYANGVLSLPVGGAASTHILKPALQPEKLYPDAVYNEALCMRLATAIGLPVAAVELLTEPEPVLLVERFDRVVDRASVHRLHQLDFCQLAGLMPDQKCEADSGPGLVDVFAIVDQRSALPARDRLQLVDWLLFNYLIGNADAHAKNVAMLYGHDGRLRLAPAYDLVSTTYWSSLSDKLAMSIGGEGRPRWVMQRHWQKLCDEVGLNRTQLRRRSLGLIAAAGKHLVGVADALGLAQASPLFRHIEQTVAKRGRWLEDRLVA
ncbi:type II toxin-antitoxin system HipA family toxin [Dyella subtropica]|uniref:type II toxin-antitoxin system HipA family toxin n=1 Tax=Dyella subtropica TaxID=2992127 RepID=UPI00224CA9E9|nr:type II toxin-antitoxin system HipA family toxin [Dyella subtropica]